MASIQSFTITPTGRKNIPGSTPTFTISALVYDDAGSLIGDFTGANVIDFPVVLATLTDAQVTVLSRIVAMWLVRTKAGIVDPVMGW